jgi:hypothetical protein
MVITTQYTLLAEITGLPILFLVGQKMTGLILVGVALGFYNFQNAGLNPHSTRAIHSPGLERMFIIAVMYLLGADRDWKQDMMARTVI